MEELSEKCVLELERSEKRIKVEIDDKRKQSIIETIAQNFYLDLKNFFDQRLTKEELNKTIWFHNKSILNEWFYLIDELYEQQSVKIRNNLTESEIRTNSQEWLEFTKEDDPLIDHKLDLFSKKVKDSKHGWFCQEFSNIWNLLSFFIWLNATKQEAVLEIHFLIDHLLEELDSLNPFSVERSNHHSKLLKIWSMFQLYIWDVFSTLKNHHLESILTKIDRHFKSQIRPIHYFWNSGKIEYKPFYTSFHT